MVEWVKPVAYMVMAISLMPMFSGVGWADVKNGVVAVQTLHLAPISCGIVRWVMGA